MLAAVMLLKNLIFSVFLFSRHETDEHDGGLFLWLTVYKYSAICVEDWGLGVGVNVAQLQVRRMQYSIEMKYRSVNVDLTYAQSNFDIDW